MSCWIRPPPAADLIARLQHAAIRGIGSVDSVPSMDDLLSHWLPGVTTLDSGFPPPPSPERISWEQQATWYEVRHVLEATIQALQLSRLICRSEITTNI